MWNVIIKIKAEIKNLEDACRFISVKTSPLIELEFNHHIKDATFNIEMKKASVNGDNLLHSDLFEIKETKNAHLSSDDLNLLKLYLPYALLPYFSKLDKKCFSISHFAQTLDGRIASSSGDSKWIGNEENLIHAHRMRALCDAILVGSKTMSVDDPRLNVRLVAGQDPIKVVIGGDALPIKKYHAYDDSTITFCQNHADKELPGESVIIDKKDGYDTKTILECLYQRGIHSVYIEGGSLTTSNFLKQGSIDQVQLHISPKILGSGTSAFNFAGIMNMDQAIVFNNAQFMPMGDDVMFVGNLV